MLRSIDGESDQRSLGKLVAVPAGAMEYNHPLMTLGVRTLRLGLTALTALIGGTVVVGRASAAESTPAAASAATIAASDLLRAKQLYAAGVSELVARDFAASYKALAESYHLHPALETLYQLGILANTEGRRVEVHDLLRRYTADRGHGAIGQGPIRVPHQAEVQRILSSPPDGVGEAKVVGPAGSFVSIDERLVGVLPLSLPLLMSVGEHVLTSEYAGKHQDTKLQIVSGRVAEVRFDESGRAPQVRGTAGVGVLLTLATPGIAADQRTSFRRSLHDLLERQSLGVVDGETVAIASGSPADYSGKLEAKLDLARRSSTEYLLAVRIAKQESTDLGQWRISAVLHNLAVGAVAAQLEQGCEVCSQDQAVLILEEVGKRIIQTGTHRSRGTLQVRSTPDGAEVLLGERRLGTTPLDVTLFTGLHPLVVKHRDSVARRVLAAVEDARATAIEVELLPVAAASGGR